MLKYLADEYAKYIERLAKNIAWSFAIFFGLIGAGTVKAFLFPGVEMNEGMMMFGSVGALIFGFVGYRIGKYIAVLICGLLATVCSINNNLEAIRRSFEGFPSSNRPQPPPIKKAG